MPKHSKNPGTLRVKLSKSMKIVTFFHNFHTFCLREPFFSLNDSIDIGTNVMTLQRKTMTPCFLIQPQCYGGIGVGFHSSFFCSSRFPASLQENVKLDSTLLAKERTTDFSFNTFKFKLFYRSRACFC